MISSRFILGKTTTLSNRLPSAKRELSPFSHFRRGNNSVLDPAKSGITRTASSSSKTAEIDPNHHQDSAWGLSKSAWSFREFAPLVAETMKQRGG
jgi:hypothetical protein